MPQVTQVVQTGVKRSEKGSRLRSPPLPSDVPREAAAAQKGQGVAQGHPAVNLLPPRPELFPWPQANWPHFLEGAGGTHLLQPDSPRATQLPLLPLLLEKVSPEHKEQLRAGPKRTPGNPPSPPFCAEPVDSVLHKDTMRSAPSAHQALLEREGSFLGLVATQELRTPAPQW